MRIVLLVLCLSLTCFADELSDSVNRVRQVNPFAADTIVDRLRVQKDSYNLDKLIAQERSNLQDYTTPVPPLKTPFKVMTPSLNNLIVRAQRYTNTAKQEHTHVPNTSTSEMMFMQQLQHTAKKADKALNKPVVNSADTSARLQSLQRLVNQMSRISANLKSPEKEQAYTHAHAQSRMLHRLSHVMDKTNGRLEAAKQHKFNTMLDTMVHHHLNDPHYYDELHDHLLAHHLARAKNQNDFADHVAHNVLYHRLGTHIADEDQLNNYLATNAARDLAIQARTQNLNGLNSRIISSQIQAKK